MKRAILIPFTIALVTATLGRAASITWTPSLFTDSGQVTTYGSLLGAYNFGSDSDVTVNGVMFAAENDGDTSDSTFFQFSNNGLYLVYNAAPTMDRALNAIDGLADPDRAALLDSMAYESTQEQPMTIRGLTAGEAYAVQVLVVDDRAGLEGRSMHFSPSGGVWGVAYDYSSIGYPLLMTGTFTADAETQDFRQGIAGTGHPQMQAIQVRWISAPAEPAVINTGATAIGAVSAILTGSVTTGYPYPDVTVTWWEDGGSTGSVILASTQGPFSASVTGLTKGALHHYYCAATNSWGMSVSTTSSFTTLSSGTTFLASPGTEVYDPNNWNNGFPNTANGDGTIATSGTLTVTGPLGYAGDGGTVTVSHTAGTLNAFDVNLHNTGGGAIYHWNQSGGNLTLRLLNPNVLVTYTLSGDGVITGSAGGARIQPFNSGLFRQVGGTLVNMGVESGYGTTVELSGGTIAGCGALIPSQALWAHGSSASVIGISGTHAIAFSADVSAFNAVLLTDGAQLVFDPAWQGSWSHDGFTESDWIAVVTDPGVKVGATQVTAQNFNDLFAVVRPGAAGSSIQLGLREPGVTPPLPVIESADLTAHFDASDVNGDGGVTDPGPGAGVQAWTELVGGTSLLKDLTTPIFVPAGSGGVNNRDTVRFRATATAGDLLYNNGTTFNAQTIFAVATMVDNASAGLSTLMCNGSHVLNIRQAQYDGAEYFSGNAGDFLTHNGSGVLNINGNPRLDIPGGFGTAHVVKAVRNSAVTYAGFRFSDNVVSNRRWNGDVAEVLVFDGKLDGNDTAHLNQYFEAKYGIRQVVDERITNTTQVADQPFPDADLRHLGVNFYYTPGGDTAGTLHGAAFDNINCAALPAGPIALTANSPEASLSLTWNGFAEDNTSRGQAAGISGVDADTANEVINEMFYLGVPAHASVTMAFSGLTAGRDVYVQVLGGDSGWSGDIAVTANGESAGKWMSVADGNGATGSLFAFRSTTDASGQLTLHFEGVDHYAGIGGLLITEGTPKRGGMTLIVR